MDLRNMTTEELMTEFQRRGGRGVAQWSADERAQLFGDSTLEAQRLRRYRENLLARYHAGKRLIAEEREEAERLVRIGWA